MLALAAVAFVGQGLAADLRAILATSELKGAVVSAHAIALDGEELFSLAPDRSLIPASTMKLFTAVYAIDALGLEYRPRTTAWRYRGSVYLKGGGDPGLTVEEILWLAQVLDVRPEESVLFDDTLFGKGRIGPEWEADDLHRGYAAQISPLTVNGGKATLMATAGRAWLEPRNFGVRITGTIGAGSANVRFARDQGSWTLRVWGRAPEGESVRVGTISLPDPGLCAARVFHRGAVRGGMLKPPRTLVPADSPGVRYPIGAVGEELVFIEPRTVAELLPAVLQDSDNAYAETLLRLAAYHEVGDGEWTAAIKALEAFAQRVGVSSGALRVADGSGLSRRGRVSARALTTLLRYAATRPYFTVLLDSMARPGVGTLEKRLNGVAVYAKTGTMSGISSLAGIVSTTDGRDVAFAVVMNGLSSTAAARNAQDRFVVRLSLGANDAERRRAVSGL